MRYPEWTGDELCRQVDPDAFFPSSFNAVTSKHRELLTSLCGDCTSRQVCFLWALHHESDGWWAGTTPAQRDELRRRMGIRLETPAIPITERRGAA